MAFGDAVKAERINHGWSQEELAARAGLSSRSIASIEKGSRKSGGDYSKDTLDKIEAAFLWTPGSAERVRNGGRPEYYPDPLLEQLRRLWLRLNEVQKRSVVSLIESFTSK